jgi:hypothetical protein
MDAGVKKTSESGMGLLEVMMAAVFLTVALMAIGMTMTEGLASMFMVQEQLIAKQKAREALESVFTARTTQNITFDLIQNVSAGGVFLDGFQSIRGTGADGIANTADDAAQPIETVRFPGPDGQLGNGDDITRTLTAFQRSVAISNVLLANNTVDPDIRKITVVVQYKVKGVWFSVTTSSLISRFS